MFCGPQVPDQGSTVDFFLFPHLNSIMKEVGGWSVPCHICFTPGKDPVPTAQEAGWAPGLVWMCVISLGPTRIWSQDRPAHSQSLCQLSYPSPSSSGCTSLYIQQLVYVKCLWWLAASWIGVELVSVCHQEVLFCIYSSWYMSCVYADWLLAGLELNWFLFVIRRCCSVYTAIGICHVFMVTGC
jgi:hypothetical protein